MSLKQKINNTITIYDAWSLCFGTPPPSGKVCCPFHSNTRTPAAKIYDYGLRCFGECARVYTSYDLLKTFSPNTLERLSGEKLSEGKKEVKTKDTGKVVFSIEGYYDKD